MPDTQTFRVNPKLYIHRDGGPDRLVELDRDEILIGRGGDCHVVLDEQTVSNRHARLIRRPEGYFVEDLNSHNNTVLDGVRLKGKGPTQLRKGQSFRICDYWFLYEPAKVQIQEDGGAGSAITAAVDMSTGSDVTVAPSRPEEVLKAVLEVARTLCRAPNVQEKMARTLEALFVIFPKADRGFVYLEEEGAMDGGLIPTAVLDRQQEPSPPTISRMVLEKVLRKGMALCCEDTRDIKSESIIGSGIRTLLCAPILDPDRRPLGLIQLDARKQSSRFEPKDLELLVAVADQVGLAVENDRLHRQRTWNVRVREEMDYARGVQRALLPEEPPVVAGYDFWQHYEPAREVGGDYFGYFPLFRADDEPGRSTRRWCLAVADVVGKGMGAALLMAKFSAEVQLALHAEPDPGRLVERINRRTCEIAVADRFVTMILAVLDGDTGALSVVSAGHPDPLIRRADGRVEVIGEEGGGPPLGIDQECGYEPLMVGLGPGDGLILFTDGITEAMDRRGDWFGKSRLIEAVAGLPPEPATQGRGVLHLVRRHVGDAPQSDDITLICIRRRP